MLKMPSIYIHANSHIYLSPGQFDSHFVRFQEKRDTNSRWNAFSVCLWILRAQHHFDLVSASCLRRRRNSSFIMRMCVSNGLYMLLFVNSWLYFGQQQIHQYNLSSYESNCFFFLCAVSLFTLVMAECVSYEFEANEMKNQIFWPWTLEHWTYNAWMMTNPLWA